MNRISLSLGLGAVAFGAMVLLSSCLGASATEDRSTACTPFDPLNAKDSFNTVSEVMERRCGTLDCHGQSSRPLRVYGNSGLRRPEPDLYSDGCTADKDCPGPNRICLVGTGCIDASIKDLKGYAQYYSGGLVKTTPSEKYENWQAVCGLEPEIMTIVFCCAAEPGRCDGFRYDLYCDKPEKYDPGTLTLIRKARLREKHKGGILWDVGKAGDKCLTNWVTTAYETASPTECDEELQGI
jgi:hypothetical protein